MGDSGNRFGEAGPSEARGGGEAVVVDPVLQLLQDMSGCLARLEGQEDTESAGGH